MKLNTTPQQEAAIIAALEVCHVRPFRERSSDAKTDAQSNLCGLTHYYDDETLRFHKGRVISTWTLANGLLFCALCSDAMDMDNTRRGYRVVCHDVFGTCVSRVALQDCASTSKAARKAFEQTEFDLLAHYREAVQLEFNLAAEKAAQLEAALNSILAN